ncbi:hypothetical protein BGZ60DRAFT_437684 [Tricladium varicosporioides]|nr:hypothetical protein BGZ60DRAFT_437684 [Hymenoscyphus varicosporioides]
MPSIRLLYLFFGFGLCSLGAVSAANTCVLQATNNTFGSQEEVNARLQGCTDISGDIYIQEGFNGTFSLPGITQINGKLGLSDVTIYANNSYTTLYGNTSYAGLKAVILNDLVSITGRIELYRVQGLETVSMPVLGNASNLYVKSAKAVNLSLPQLSSYHTARLEGAFSSISMPSLQTMNTTWMDLGYSYDYLFNFKTNALSLEFPLLQDAVYLTIMGNFSRISLPKTTNITGELKVYNLSPITMNLPALTDVNTLINAPSISIETRNGGISTTPVSVNFPKLLKTRYFSIRGPVLAVSLPQLEYARDINIESTLAIDCSPLQNVADRALSMHNAENSKLIFSCSGDYTEVEAAKR